MSDYRTNPGDVLHDWRRGDRVVVRVERGEDIAKYCDGRYYKGSNAERCALHGGQTRPQTFEVRD